MPVARRQHPFFVSRSFGMRIVKRLLLASCMSVVALVAVEAANAQQVIYSSQILPNSGSVCRQCGRVHQVSRPTTSSFQAQAQMEAQMMASRGYKGHVRGTIPGVSFCGVGWSSSSPAAPTCTPGSGRQLVADAVARGRDGWYRVRYWR